MRGDTIGMRLHDHSSIRSLYLHQKDEECIEKKFGSVQAKSPQPLPVLTRISSEIGAAEQRLGKPGAVQAKSRSRGNSERHGKGIKGGPRKGTAGSREGSPGAPWPRCSSSRRADPVSCGGGGGGEALPGPVGVRSVEKARESRTNRAARASPSLESRRASLPPDALVASQQPSDLA